MTSKGQCSVATATAIFKNRNFFETFQSNNDKEKKKKQFTEIKLLEIWVIIIRFILY
jgi:hypothetical protein